MAARGGEELPVAGLPLGKSTMEDWSVCASGCALHCTLAALPPPRRRRRRRRLVNAARQQADAGALLHRSVFFTKVRHDPQAYTPAVLAPEHNLTETQVRRSRSRLLRGGRRRRR